MAEAMAAGGHEDPCEENDMIRTIIQIDEEKCTGCELCVRACHEGALGMVDGKARLLRDDYCDGMGDCLPACPAGAITFVQREAAAYDEAAVAAHMAARGEGAPAGGAAPAAAESAAPAPSQLHNWPVQIKLAPPMAPYFAGADVLVAADCTAFAYGAFHQDFMRGKVTLVGCPKLDAVDYSEKLTAIFANNPVASVTIARMEVPCCGGLERAVRVALEASAQVTGRTIPLQVATISTDGRLLGVTE